MRTLLTGLLVLCFLAPAAAVSVRVSSPTSGATVNTSFTVKASATTVRRHSITGWYIYVDGNPAWNTSAPTSSITAAISVSAGSHKLLVRAWDNTGAYGGATLSINAVVPVTTVTVLSPANGASVTDPVTFTATGTSANGISGWVVYMDDQNVYQVDNYSNSLTASVNLPTGAHSIYIRAWDRLNGGYGTSPTITINVNTAAVLPTPPDNATVWSKVEDSTDGWWDCSDCAGGGSVTTNYWTAPFQTTPSMDGSSREFFNGGQGWADVLWVKKFGAQNFASHFLWDFYVQFDSTTTAGLWSAEYDLWQSIAGYEFMIGTQCAFGDGVWDTWDQLHGYWVKTSIACPRFTPNTWHHIQFYFERPSSTQYKYVTMVVDGVAYPLNQTYNASVSNWDDAFGVQWQLDLNANGTPAHEWIDQVKVTIW